MTILAVISITYVLGLILTMVLYAYRYWPDVPRNAAEVVLLYLLLFAWPTFIYPLAIDSYRKFKSR